MAGWGRAATKSSPVPAPRGRALASAKTSSFSGGAAGAGVVAAGDVCPAPPEQPPPAAAVQLRGGSAGAVSGLQRGQRGEPQRGCFQVPVPSRGREGSGGVGSGLGPPWRCVGRRSRECS